VSVGVIHWRGGEFAPLFEGLEAGRKRGARDFGMSLYWIFDAVRHFGPRRAGLVVDEAVALRRASDNIVGIGLGGDERRAAPGLFRDVYARAASEGLRRTAHAGETMGPESVWSALRELKADRIGHGLRAVEDPALVAHLAERRIPVEVCMSSNLLTGCCPSVDQHPLRQLYDAGVVVTLNTDDPDMFRTSLLREYQIAQEAHGFAPSELHYLAQNSFQASFLPEARKRELLARF
jgi:aminodeoxyfutalosine deaminase